MLSVPKRRPVRPQLEQLVFPYELALGDIVLEDGARRRPARDDGYADPSRGGQQIAGLYRTFMPATSIYRRR